MTWDQADFAMELGFSVTNPSMGDAFLMRRTSDAKPPAGYEQQVFVPTKFEINRKDWRVA